MSQGMNSAAVSRNSVAFASATPPAASTRPVFSSVAEWPLRLTPGTVVQLVAPSKI